MADIACRATGRSPVPVTRCVSKGGSEVEEEDLGGLAADDGDAALVDDGRAVAGLQRRPVDHHGPFDDLHPGRSVRAEAVGHGWPASSRLA